MGDPEDRAREARGARAILDEPGMDDETGREREHFAGQGELLGARLPERRQPLVEHAVAEEPSNDAVTPLHRVEVAVAVPATDRHTCDEVVEDEVVEHDEARHAPQGVEDPAVGVRIVADVVDGEVGSARRPLRPPLDDGQVDVLAKRGNEQCRVVGDPRRLGRHRREVGDPHVVVRP